MMIRHGLLPVVLLTGCANFDQLGDAARCRLTLCDAGVVDSGIDAGAHDAGLEDAGIEDAGLDAGDEDAGAPPDAGLEQVVVVWAQADVLDQSFYRPRAGAVLPVGMGLIAHLREFEQRFDGPEVIPDSGVGFPTGSILGDIVALDLSDGAYVLEDGGRSSAPTDLAARSFVPGARGPVNELFPFFVVPFNERLVDGGTPLAADGGRIAYGNGVLTFKGWEGLVDAQFTGPVKAATFLDVASDAGPDFVWVPEGPDAGLIIVNASGATLSAGSHCPAPVVDAVTTVTTRGNGTPEHRLLQLAECAPNDWTVISWSNSQDPLRFPLTPTADVRDARLAISSIPALVRHPFAVWKDTLGFFHLTRFSLDGKGVGNTRLITGQSAQTRIGAIAVDALDRPVVIFEATSLPLVGLSASVQAPNSRVIVAGFDVSMRLRWAAPLAIANVLRINSATFVEGALVLDADCPANPQMGDFCTADRSTFAVRIGLADGGLP